MLRKLQFRTNLNCASCVAAVRPWLDALPGISGWEVDTTTTEKLLTVTGADVSVESVRAAVRHAGFEATDSTDRGAAQPHSAAASAAVPDAGLVTYYPLLLLGSFLTGVVLLVELRSGSPDIARAMQNFMGAFFVTFSFFKLLDLPGFASAYRTYDLVARRFPAYAWAYPFIELGLGVACIADFQPRAVNLLTLMVMTVSILGVLQSVLQRRRIRCACLGTVFNLPMSTVTLIEDGLMILMAAAGLAGVGH